MNDTATMVIRLSLNGAQEVARGVSGVLSTFGSIPHVLGTINEHAFFLIENLRNAIEIAHRFGEVLAESFIMPNAEKERYRAQFEFMLGTAEAAAKRLDELDAFKAKNPFDEKSIMDASIALSRFGDGALATGDGLQIVADLAAYTNTGLAEMAQTVGRAYSSIASGDGVGRAAMQLVALGVVTKADAERLDAMAGAGDKVKDLKEQIATLDLELRKHDAEAMLRASSKGADPLAAFDVEATEAKRKKLEEMNGQLSQLQSTMARPEEIWSSFVSLLDRSNGAADRVRKTFTGTMQALRNEWDEFKERTGTGIFQSLETDVSEIETKIKALFDYGTVDRWANRIGDELKKLYAELKGRAFLGLGFEDVEGGLNSGTILSVLGVALKDSFHNAFAELYNLAITKGPDIVSALTPGWMRHFVQQDTADEMRSLAQGNNPGALSWAAQSRLAQELMKQTGGRYEAALAQVSGMMDGNGSGLAGLQKLAASNIHFDLMPLIDIQADLQRRNIGRYALEADLSGSQAVAGEQVRLMRLMELSLGAANKEAAALAGNLRSANAQF